jgi:hypothetical protein
MTIFSLQEYCSIQPTPLLGATAQTFLDNLGLASTHPLCATYNLSDLVVGPMQPKNLDETFSQAFITGFGM